MTGYRLIQRKRDGHELSPGELAEIFRAYAEDRLPDYQMAAFLMAVYFRGLSGAELAALVEIMLHSGDVLDLSAIPGPKIDKHSTGGVGDKVSLVLAPLAASLGIVVPMVSGRSLGHSGGTLDKLESIPGFRTDLSTREFRAQLERLRCALIGATAEIAPLDRRLYALRDVTGTVESIPLIASSIMSKKLAEGIDGLVLDVKHGAGAFLPERERALELARTLIEIGRTHRCHVVALLTGMEQPLGYAVGNALEVEEAILTLRGEGPPDVRELTIALAGEMLVLGRLAPDAASGRRAARAALDDGRALERMRQVIEAQGGNASVLDDPAILPQAPVRRVFEAAAAGTVVEVNARAIGHAAVALGAGRSRLGEPVDPAVGFHITARIGSFAREGQALATVHARTPAHADAALAALGSAIRIAAEPKREPPPLITHRVTAAGVESWTSET
ncbi:MAG: thymidine phosphorylase [Gemmatimonadetes bacterium]|nr:thymidine phosphorylase [Gemmatimonadota bacterium]